MCRNRNATTALVLSLAVLGGAIDARADSPGADCQRLHGSIDETRIPSDATISRLLGTVTGTLNGASTVYITGLTPPASAASFDVFLTKKGDVLWAIGASTRTPVPGQPGEFISHVDLTITGGYGRYDGATGTMTFDGFSHAGSVPQTAELIYRGEVCGPNVKAHGHDED
jgi:hypothetical protein